YMTLERKDADLTGRYFYERAGAFKVFEKKGLELKGRVDGDGNVALTETSDETGNPQKTGEFTGKLDGLGANGAVSLRFSGLWTGGKDGKQMPFSFRQRVFDLCGLKLDGGADKSAKATAERLCGDRQAYNNIDDEIIGANKDFISALSRYEHLGSLHPYTTTKSFNYDLKRHATVRLADLF